jgi:hypothetical protein
MEMLLTVLLVLMIPGLLTLLMPERERADASDYDGPRGVSATHR